MRTRLKLTAAVVAASMAIGSVGTPASAALIAPGAGGGGAGASGGATFLGVCIFSGAAGLIWAALAKGRAFNNDKIELTRQEAMTIGFSCGLGALPVIGSWRRN